MAVLAYKDEAGAENQITFDATIREDVSHTAFVTQYPVENGESIADHSQPAPLSITLEGFVSDTPIRTPDSLTDGVNGEVSNKKLDLPEPPAPAIGLPSGRLVEQIVDRIVPGTDSALVLQFDGKLNRTVNVFNALDTLLKAGTPMTVALSEDQQFFNMVLTSISRPRSAGQGSGLTFQMEFVQVKVVTSKVGAAPVPLTPRASIQKNKGNQASSDSSGSISAAKITSLAAKLSGF